MTTAVRLPLRIEQALARYCLQTRRTKSEVIVELLEQRLLGSRTEAAPYELATAAGFIGCVEGNSGDAANAKQLVRRRVQAKHARTGKRHANPAA